MKITLKISCAVLAVSSIALWAQQPGTPATSAPTTPQTGNPVSGVTPGADPAAQRSSPDAKPTDAPQASTPSNASARSVSMAAGVDSHYIIGPEDALQITVWHEPTLSGSFPVRPDGMISMVLLNDVSAAGKTPTQLGSEIGERLRKYIQDPSVTVQVMAVNSQKIYLIGEVGHVGAIPLSADMSPLKAIAAAGGLSPFANSKHIYILRGTGATQQKIPFNYKQALKGDDRQQVVLHAGDTIVVP